MPALGILVGLGLIAGAVLTADPDDRLGVAIWMGAAVVAACSALALAMYFRAELHRGGDEITAVRTQLDRTRARIADLEQTVAAQRSAAEASERRSSAAIASLSNAAGRMQAMTTTMLATLQELEHRYADQAVLTDLLKLDHTTAQAGRLADSIAILAGARTGRRWAKPIVLERVLRAAIGRVGGYQRVRLRAVADSAIAGHAAEGVIHALAELVDNACRFSPPTTEVHIYSSEIPAGVVVTIEDSGLVMSESSLRRAQIAVSGVEDEAQDGLSALNGTRFGLAVVGRLARKHGLTISYRPSAIGGTAAVVLIPRELVTQPDKPALQALTQGSPAQSNTASAESTGSWARMPVTPSTAESTGSRTLASPPPPASASPVRQPITASGQRTEGQEWKVAEAGGWQTVGSTGWQKVEASGRHRSGEFDLPTATRPADLPTTTRPADLPTATRPAPTAGSPVPERLAPPELSARQSTPAAGRSVLPKRSRGSTLAAAHPEGLPPRAITAHDSGPVTQRMKPATLGAFQRAISGRAADAGRPSRHHSTTDREDDR